MRRTVVLSLLLAGALMSSPAAAACPPTYLLAWRPVLGIQSLAVGADGNVYALYWDGVRVFSADGVLLRTWSPAGGYPYGFDQPHDIAVGAQSHVYVTDRFGGLQEFTSTGTFVKRWTVSRGCTMGIDGMTPISVATDADGNVYVLAGYTCQVEKYAPDGTLLLTWGSCGSGEGQFGHCREYSIAVDRQGFAYVSDQGRVQKFTSGGTYLGVLGTSVQPQHVAVDGDDRISVVDYWGSRIQTFAGDGTVLCEWDPCAASGGEICSSSAASMAGGSGGTIYVTDGVGIAKFGDVATPASRYTWGALKTLYR